MLKKSSKAESRKPAFAPAVARPKKRVAGRTAVERTPISVRGSMPIDEALEREIRQRLARALGRFAALLERGTVRFEDVNGPRGGVDTECRVKLVMSGKPSVIASARAATPEKAFAAVLPKVKAGATGAVEKRRPRVTAGRKTIRRAPSAPGRTRRAVAPS